MIKFIISSINLTSFFFFYQPKNWDSNTQHLSERNEYIVLWILNYCTINLRINVLLIKSSIKKNMKFNHICIWVSQDVLNAFIFFLFSFCVCVCVLYTASHSVCALVLITLCFGVGGTILSSSSIFLIFFSVHRRKLIWDWFSDMKALFFFFFFKKRYLVD